MSAQFAHIHKASLNFVLKITKMNEKDKLSFDLIKAIKKANNQILKLENEVVKDYNLTTLQYGVLEALYIKGDMRVSDLIERLISTSGTMTVVIRNLEKSGLVARECNSEDRRSCMIILTDKGRKIVKAISPSRREIANDFADTLNEREKAELLGLLYKFKERYKEKK